MNCVPLPLPTHDFMLNYKSKLRQQCSLACSGNHQHAHTLLSLTQSLSTWFLSHTRTHTQRNTFLSHTHSVCLSGSLCPDLLKGFQGRVSQPTTLSVQRLSRFKLDASLSSLPNMRGAHAGVCAAMRKMDVFSVYVNMFVVSSPFVHLLMHAYVHMCKDLTA